MPRPVLVVLITVGIGLPAFALGPQLWPQAAASPKPSEVQLPFFVVLALIEALLFGLGIAFLIFGLPTVRRAAARVGVNPWPVFVAIAWQLLSWWPHDNLHVATGLDYWPLLGIEYAFHLTLIISALIVAHFFLAVLHSIPAPAIGRV